MSGHSKWHKIQHKKGKNDAKRGNMFTKLCRAVTVAAQQGGGDPDMNFSLRLAVEKARAGNVPKDNIERAIKRGTGELKDGAVLEEVTYEGFGPNGVAFLVDAVTDNKNRTVSEVKHAFTKHGGSLGGPGSVQWQFEKRGVVRLSDLRNKLSGSGDSMDDFELSVIDAGAQDVKESEFGVEIHTTVESFAKVLDAVKEINVEPDDSSLEWVAKETIKLEDELLQRVSTLHEALDELDDVRAVYSNET